MNKDLLRIAPNGEYALVPCSYDGIRAGVGNWFDFVLVTETRGFYVDDEGMLNGSPLNVPVSIATGRAIYGNAVLTNGATDDEGETLPPNQAELDIMCDLADAWHSVTLNAEANGQVLNFPVADEATIPPPQIISFNSNEEFFAHMFGEPASPAEQPYDQEVEP